MRSRTLRGIRRINAAEGRAKIIQTNAELRAELDLSPRHPTLPVYSQQNKSAFFFLLSCLFSLMVLLLNKRDFSFCLIAWQQ